MPVLLQGAVRSGNILLLQYQSGVRARPQVRLSRDGEILDGLLMNQMKRKTGMGKI